jgi:TPR repeat protein
MGYVVQVWEQPPKLALPGSLDDAVRLLGLVRERPPIPNSQFTELGRRLTRRYPGYTGKGDENTCAWADGSVEDGSSDPVWNIGLASIDALDEVQAFVVVQANALGLHVMDEQAGEVHLADGTVFSLHARGPCVKGLAAYFEGRHDEALGEFRQLATAGNTFAQRQLGAMYLNGNGVRRNTVVGCALVCSATGWQPEPPGPALPPTDAAAVEEGLQVRKHAGPAATALADALLPRLQNAGQLLVTIDRVVAGVEARFKEAEAAARSGDHETALAELKPLAEQGHEVAQFLLSLMHADGRGVPRDAEQSALWMRRSAQGGFAKAQHNLGWLYEEGKVLAQDLAEAERWYHHAATAGDSRSIEALRRVTVLRKRPSVEEELAITRLRAEQGNAQAQYEMGEALLHGEATGRPDAVEAARWYALAAKQSHGDACFALAGLCKSGDGTPQDDAQAAHWFHLAAEQGVVQAQYNLGLACHLGDGLPKSDMKAMQWFGQAANQFHGDALFNLGLMYDKGLAVERDGIAAKALFLLAHSQGSTQPFDRSFAEGELAHVKVLVQSMTESGKVLDSLAAWRRRGGAAAVQANPAYADTQHLAPPSDTDLDEAPDSIDHRYHAGHVALLISVLCLPTVPLMPQPGMAAACTLWLLGAAFGFFGALKVGRDLGYRPPWQLAAQALMLVPLIGNLVGLGLLAQMLLRRHARRSPRTGFNLHTRA